MRDKSAHHLPPTNDAFDPLQFIYLFIISIISWVESSGVLYRRFLYWFRTKGMKMSIAFPWIRVSRAIWNGALLSRKKT